MSNAIVAQLRQAELGRIMINPTNVFVDARPLIDNGFGTMVPVLNSTEMWVEKGPVRIVARQHPVLQQTDLRASYSQSSGLSETYGIGNDFVLFATYDCDWLVSGIILKYNERTYKTFEQYNYKMFDEIISIFCMLKDVGSVN